MQSQSRAVNQWKEKVQTGSDDGICIIVLHILKRYNEENAKETEVNKMSDTFKVETFVDVHSNIFEEYLSSVTAKLRRENEEYRSIQSEIEELYEKYPKVLDVFDMEKSAELREQECTVLIKVIELKNKLTDMEMQSVYFRGCYDSAGYMKKAGVL